jgi:hypothetical protein
LGVSLRHPTNPSPEVFEHVNSIFADATFTHYLGIMLTGEKFVIGRDLDVY